MDKSQLQQSLEMFELIAAVLHVGSFQGAHSDKVTTAREFVAKMCNTLSEQINASSRDPQDATGVASSGSGNRGRQSRKRKDK